MADTTPNNGADLGGVEESLTAAARRASHALLHDEDTIPVFADDPHAWIKLFDAARLLIEEAETSTPFIAQLGLALADLTESILDYTEHPIGEPE